MREGRGAARSAAYIRAAAYIAVSSLSDVARRRCSRESAVIARVNVYSDALRSFFVNVLSVPQATRCAVLLERRLNGIAMPLRELRNSRESCVVHRP